MCLSVYYTVEIKYSLEHVNLGAETRSEPGIAQLEEKEILQRGIESIVFLILQNYSINDTGTIGRSVRMAEVYGSRTHQGPRRATPQPF